VKRGAFLYWSRKRWTNRHSREGGNPEVSGSARERRILCEVLGFGFDAVLGVFFLFKAEVGAEGVRKGGFDVDAVNLRRAAGRRACSRSASG
jgi:hypothetical protein